VPVTWVPLTITHAAGRYQFEVPVVFQLWILVLPLFRPRWGDSGGKAEECFARALSAGGLSIACRGVKCTSETRPGESPLRIGLEGHSSRQVKRDLQ
jgi:hypothetical protein